MSNSETTGSISPVGLTQAELTTEKRRFLKVHRQGPDDNDNEHEKTMVGVTVIMIMATTFILTASGPWDLPK